MAVVLDRWHRGPRASADGGSGRGGSCEREPHSCARATAHWGGGVGVGEGCRRCVLAWVTTAALTVPALPQ